MFRADTLCGPSRNPQSLHIVLHLWRLRRMAQVFIGLFHRVARGESAERLTRLT
ncbi:hypothetical protein [Stutzerimonas stutzeri]|uniref:Transposase n=1 Tax=Stutzerimonas stutzeri KOS6 TaxID=1218352 RepID=A0A061JNR4_STUST|nr:hypothetical protein [Stutzerimonas stutzeri]EWC39990.1 hypothetical protein B597_017535 [Stutzerimonas stutzeri KOS6]